MREVATTKYQLPGVGCLVLVSWAGKAACRDREALTLASIAQTLYVGTLCFECKVISMVLMHPSPHRPLQMEIGFENKTSHDLSFHLSFHLQLLSRKKRDKPTSPFACHSGLHI